MADAATDRTVRSARLKWQRERRLELMASFCRFWTMTPAEYKQLTVEELEAMTRFANDEINQRKRERAKAKRSRRR